jgi:hypothetical protein
MITGKVVEQHTYETNAFSLHTILSALNDGTYEIEVNLEHGGEHYHVGEVVDDGNLALTAYDMENDMLTAHGLQRELLLR